MAENGYSLSDIASITGGRGFGGGDGVLALLFLLIFMNGGWGFGGNRGNFATQSEMQQGFDNQNTMANQREILSAVSSGTSQTVAAVNQAKYDNINVAKDIQMAIASELGRLETQGASLLANQNQCCFNTLRAIDGVKFDAAQNTASINANMTAQTQKILDAMAQSKIDSLQNQVNQLQLQQAVAGVVRYPTNASYSIPVPNVWGNPPPNPFFG